MFYFHNSLFFIAFYYLLLLFIIFYFLIIPISLFLFSPTISRFYCTVFRHRLTKTKTKELLHKPQLSTCTNADEILFHSPHKGCQNVWFTFLATFEKSFFLLFILNLTTDISTSYFEATFHHLFFFLSRFFLLLYCADSKLL